MESPLLNQTELARRWRLSSRTLERWRWLNKGPDFVKFGRAVRYRLLDIESYERSQLRRVDGSIALIADSSRLSARR